MRTISVCFMALHKIEIREVLFFVLKFNFLCLDEIKVHLPNMHIMILYSSFSWFQPTKNIHKSEKDKYFCPRTNQLCPI